MNIYDRQQPWERFPLGYWQSRPKGSRRPRNRKTWHRVSWDL